MELELELPTARGGTLAVVGRAARLPESLRLEVELNGVSLGELLLSEAENLAEVSVPTGTAVIGPNLVRLTVLETVPRDGVEVREDYGVRLVAFRPAEVMPLTTRGGETPEIPGGTSIIVSVSNLHGAHLELDLEVDRPGSVRCQLEVLTDTGEREMVWTEERSLPPGRSVYGFDIPGDIEGRGELGLVIPKRSPAVRLFGAKIKRPDYPPNVVLIVVDTLRGDAIVAPDGTIRAPRVRELAEDGVVFTKAFSHASMTLPAHTSLFSSRPPVQSRVLANGDAVPEDLPLVAEWLAQHGYSTAASVSIYSLMTTPGRVRLERGFDQHAQSEPWMLPLAVDSFERARAGFDRIGAERPFFLFFHMSDPHAPYRAHGSVERRASLSVDGVERAEILTSMAEAWVDEIVLEPGRHELVLESEDPFRVRTCNVRVGAQGLDLEVDGRAIPSGTAYSSSNGATRMTIAFEVRDDADRPTSFRLVLEDMPGRQERAERYQREAEYADRFTGELIDLLRERGLYDHTLIVFTSDHGEGLGEHGWFVHVANVYDELIHVPLIIKPPAGHPSRGRMARSTDQLVRHVDVVPTILSIVGLPPLPDQTGVSLEEREDRVLLAGTHPPFASDDILTLRDDRYKLIYAAGADTFELYDVVEDPDELVNVYEARIDEREGWADLLRFFAAEATGLARDEDMDPELRSNLNALGYVDHDD